MAVTSSKYGFQASIRAPFQEAVEKITAALQEQGFGVLTEIDVKKTLHEKIGADFRRYVILGACNPVLAHRALSTELEVGLLLPCNVVVYDGDDGDCVVSIVDPGAMLGVVGNPDLDPVAAEAREKMMAALETVAE